MAWRNERLHFHTMGGSTVLTTATAPIHTISVKIKWNTLLTKKRTLNRMIIFIFCIHLYTLFINHNPSMTFQSLKWYEIIHFLMFPWTKYTNGTKVSLPLIFQSIWPCVDLHKHCWPLCKTKNTIKCWVGQSSVATYHSVLRELVIHQNTML